MPTEDPIERFSERTGTIIVDNTIKAYEWCRRNPGKALMLAAGTAAALLIPNSQTKQSGRYTIQGVGYGIFGFCPVVDMVRYDPDPETTGGETRVEWNRSTHNIVVSKRYPSEGVYRRDLDKWAGDFPSGRTKGDIYIDAVAVAKGAGFRVPKWSPYTGR